MCFANIVCKPTQLGISISVGSSHQLSLPGENVTLTCRVQGQNPMLEDQSVSWIKTVNNEDTQIVSFNDVIRGPYSFTKRYQVETVPVTTAIISILNIFDVRAEDTGFIGCFFSSFFRNKVYTTLQVAKPPNSIELMTNADGRVLFSNDQLLATCSVTEVVPIPHVTIHLGSKVLDAWSTTNVTTNVGCSTKESQPSCPVHLSYNIFTVLTRYRVSDGDDGQLLSCEVNTSHSTITESKHHHHHHQHHHHHHHQIIFSSRSFAVNVRYAPIFNCSKLHHADIRAHNFAIECVLSFNPKPHHVSVWWEDKNVEVASMKDGVMFEQIYLTSRKSLLRLILTEVTHKHFTTFHIVASNDVNSTTHPLHLRRSHYNINQESSIFAVRHPPPQNHKHGSWSNKASQQITFLNFQTCFSFFLFLKLQGVSRHFQWPINVCLMLPVSMDLRNNFHDDSFSSK